jgi:lipopolysaccharide export system permease protein
MPTLFDRYVMGLTLVTTIIIALSLTLIILLTQSIRYLELVISADASPTYFLIMIAYAVPKFLEAILPLAFAIATIYCAQRLIADRETIIMAAAGNPVTTFGKGFILSAFILMLFQFALSGWLSPMAVSDLQDTRADVKSHYATLAFREGVFNNFGNGLTAYVEKRQGINELLNLMIHDDTGSLNEGVKTTILAKRGIVNLTDNNQQLLIYDGTQYQENMASGQISRLDFEQYSLDIPTQETALTPRWREPDERTFPKLFITDTSSDTDIRNKDSFTAEIHKRITTPMLYLAFTLSILVIMFLGSWNRRRQTAPLIQAAIVVIMIQALHIGLFSAAQDNPYLNILPYIIVFIPIIFGIVRLRFHARN